MNWLRYWTYSLLLLLTGIVCLTLQANRQRHVTFLTGRFESSLNAELSIFDDDMFSTWFVTAQSPSTFHVFPPKTFHYDTVNLEAHFANDTTFRAVVSVPGLNYVNKRTNGVLTPELLSKSVIWSAAQNDKPTQERAKRYVAEMFDILKSAADGSLFWRRTFYENESGINFRSQRFVRSSGIPASLYVWLIGWSFGAAAFPIYRKKAGPRYAIEPGSNHRNSVDDPIIVSVSLLP